MKQLTCARNSALNPFPVAAQLLPHVGHNTSQSPPILACSCTLQALGLFQQAMDEGHFKQQRWEGQGLQRVEVNLHAMTAGAAPQAANQLPLTLLSLQDTICLGIPGALATLSGQEDACDRTLRKLAQGSSLSLEPANAAPRLALQSSLQIEAITRGFCCRAGVAMLSLYTWLMGLRARLVGGGHGGRGALPTCLAVVTDKGKSSKEQGNLVVKEAVAAMMAGWGAPFRCALPRLFRQPVHTCVCLGNPVVKEAVAAMMAGWGAPFRCALPCLFGLPYLVWQPCVQLHWQSMQAVAAMMAGWGAPFRCARALPRLFWLPSTRLRVSAAERPATLLCASPQRSCRRAG